MAGLFSAIDTLSSALDAFQTELSVTGNNVSNVNTPGYTRERADLVQAPTITQNGGRSIPVGSGVTVGSVNRIQNMFLQQQSNASSANSGQLSSMSDGLAAIQSVLNEPGSNGVSNALSSFFNAFSGLASNPGDSSQQLAVQTAATTLSQRVQTLSQDLNTQASQNNQSITTTVQSIQTAMNNLANLNQQIHLSSTSSSLPNSLLDQRDQQVNALSSLVGVQSQINPDGTATVTMNGMTLVNQSGAIQFPANINAANSTVTTTDGTTFPITSGQLAGQFTLSNTIAGYQSQLDTLANTVTSQVNSVYATATDSAGNTNMQFFAASTPPAAALGAAGFALAPAIAANSSAIATGTSGNASDGGVALAISQMQNTKVAGLGNQSIQGFYTNFVAAVGTQVSYYNTQVATQTSVTAQITSQIQSVSGVSLDGEMSSMLEYQRSYQASAQALSSINTAMNSLMSMLA